MSKEIKNIQTMKNKTHYTTNNGDTTLAIAHNNIAIVIDDGNIRVADVKFEFEFDDSYYYLDKDNMLAFDNDELYKDAVKYLHECAEYLSSLSPDELNAKATIDRYHKRLIIGDIAIGIADNDIKGTVDWFVDNVKRYIENQKHV